MSRSSVFRDALQVSPERIATMGDADLSDLMADLLRAQAHRCRSPLSEVRVNTEDKAKDDGCDGWTAKPANNDDWLGDANTCWQFKAGSAGTPSRLRGEVVKPIPRRTLKAGGRFVVVATGSTNGIKGEEDRLEILRDEASAAGIPTERIEVIGSERLANWCNRSRAWRRQSLRFWDREAKSDLSIAHALGTDGPQGLIDANLEALAGFDHRQDHGPEAITPVGLAEKALFAPDDIGTQRPFGGVVGHRHAGMIEKGPEAGEVSQ